MKKGLEKSAFRKIGKDKAKIQDADLLFTTQFFTDKYMVKYLVDESLNSLGIKNIEKVVIIDCASGGGNFLNYSFERLYSLYRKTKPNWSDQKIVDFILNNFGLFKSYAASPSNRAMNQRIIGQELKTVRSSLKKQASYYIVNNNEDRAYELLAAVKATFIQEYPFDPKEATEKWSDWADSFIDEIGESPMWRGMSKKHMKSEILRVKRFEADNRSQALNEWVEALRLAMKMR